MQAVDDAKEVEPEAGPEEPRRGSVDLVVAEMLRGLLDGRYVPGQKLTEADLTRKFGVSRGSVREAMRKLEAEGLVSASLHRGVSIRMFNRDDVRDILEVSEHLACLAARLAAERLTRTKDADRLRAILVEMAEQVKRGDPFEVSRSRYDFLAEIVSLTHNKELRRLLPRFDATLMRAQFRGVFKLSSAKEDLDHFRHMMDAIVARDGERAAEVMRSYSRRFGSAIHQSPDSHFAD